MRAQVCFVRIAPLAKFCHFVLLQLDLAPALRLGNINKLDYDLNLPAFELDILPINIVINKPLIYYKPLRPNVATNNRIPRIFTRFRQK